MLSGRCVLETLSGRNSVGRAFGGHIRYED
jgi:hypothetical protein